MLFTYIPDKFVELSILHTTLDEEFFLRIDHPRSRSPRLRDRNTSLLATSSTLPWWLHDKGIQYWLIDIARKRTRKGGFRYVHPDYPWLIVRHANDRDVKFAGEFVTGVVRWTFTEHVQPRREIVIDPVTCNTFDNHLFAEDIHTLGAWLERNKTAPIARIRTDFSN